MLCPAAGLIPERHRRRSDLGISLAGPSHSCRRSVFLLHSDAFDLDWKGGLFMSTSPKPFDGRASSGIAGLDEVLRGGFPMNRLYLVHGNPGSGKTTLALQFLLEGIRNSEQVLYV